MRSNCIIIKTLSDGGFTVKQSIQKEKLSAESKKMNSDLLWDAFLDVGYAERIDAGIPYYS